jgi:hypothetical protein
MYESILNIIAWLQPIRQRVDTAIRLREQMD